MKFPKNVDNFFVIVIIDVFTTEHLIALKNYFENTHGAVVPIPRIRKNIYGYRRKVPLYIETG